MGPLLLLPAAVALVAGLVLLVTTAYSVVLFAIGSSLPQTQLPPVEWGTEVYVLIAALNRSPALEETLQWVDEIRGPKLRLLVALGMEQEDLTESQGDILRPLDVFEAEGSGGKAYTLNRGFWHTLGYFLLLDEDSHPDPDCVTKMVPYLKEDEKVWAVVGHPYPSNQDSGVLQRTLSLEAGAWAAVARARDRFGLFLPAPGFFSLIRWESLNCPSGTPAWNEDALAEDTELSVRQYVKGWKTRLSTARVGIEAPPTMKALFLQRVRWYKGMLEALWWNARLLLRLPLGKGIDVAVTLLTPMAPAAFLVLLLLSPLWPGVILPALLGLLALQLVAAWMSTSKLRRGRTGVVLFSVPYMLIQGAAALAALGAFLFHVKVPWQRTPKKDDVRDRSTSNV
ncbi:MAG: glycosyltransferase family 2 protein [Thaumarchaeota archaeon]|nr:glycosyltransferase family 2 protein [Nitrososphaerota archaeon]